MNRPGPRRSPPPTSGGRGRGSTAAGRADRPVKVALRRPDAQPTGRTEPDEGRCMVAPGTTQRRSSSAGQGVHERGRCRPDLEAALVEHRPPIRPVHAGEERLASQHVEAGGSRGAGAEVDRGPAPSASNRSACPMFWTGRVELRWVRIGLAGQPANGPEGLGPRAIVTACPRSVPPSARRRYQMPPSRRGAALQGRPGHSPARPGRPAPAADRSSSQPGLEDAHPLPVEPKAIAFQVRIAVTRRPRRVRVDPEASGTHTGSLHGPAGSSA